MIDEKLIGKNYMQVFKPNELLKINAYFMYVDSKDDDSFRLTFDTNITARDYDLDLSKGVYGKKYCDDNTYIMEIKCAGGLPFWFLRALQEIKAYPGSFSKYGKVYEANYFNKVVAF